MLKQFRSRWNDKSFLALSLPLVRQLINERSLAGPADLRGIIIGHDGALNELLSVNLFRTKLSHVDFGYAAITGSLAESEFDAVVFDNARLMHARLSKSSFHRCSFDAAKLQVNADDAQFSNCTFRCAEFSKPRALQEWGGRRVRFESCDFAGADFRGVEFRASTFSNCHFEECTMTKCDLRGVRFVGASPQLVDCIT